MSLNTMHNVSLTEGQISTILYTMEGYMQGSDDNEDDPNFSKMLMIFLKY